MNRESRFAFLGTEYRIREREAKLVARWRAYGDLPVNQRSVARMAQKFGFPVGRWSDGHHGLHAQYDNRGRLTEMYWLIAGAPSRRQLKLRPKTKWGELVVKLESGGEDKEEYANGHVENYDAWSDNQRPELMSWRAWTRGSVSSMLGRHRCLLCGQGVHELPAAVHTEDDLNHLCRPCSTSLTTQPPNGRAWPIGKRECGVCLKCFGDEVLMHERRCGKLCLPCGQSMKAVVRPDRFWALGNLL
jgi:hypothetical protein